MKRKRNIIIGLICIIIVSSILGNYIIFHVIPIKKSHESFNQAVIFEIQHDYKNSLKCYSEVIVEDKDNYEKAIEKIDELNLIFEENKMATIGCVILKQEGYVADIKEITDIKTNASEHMMTCRINGIGYIVSRNSLGDDDYFVSSKTNVEEYYVTEYKATFVENGSLTNTLNQIRQETSETSFLIEELLASDEYLRDDLVADYLSEYQLNGDLPILRNDENDYNKRNNIRVTSTTASVTKPAWMEEEILEDEALGHD